MIDTLLNGLGYVGSSLAKPGRAVRGLLGGRPDELMAALPFSDSLGMTDPGNAVSGHDLLKQWGADPGDDIGGTLAGIGVDVGTDPLLYGGGFLARSLLRGLGRGRAAGSPELFDLVDPAEHALDARNAEMIDRAFPVPAARVPEGIIPAPSPLKAELVPEPPGGLLDTLPHPEQYGHQIGYGPAGYDPEQYGTVSDLYREGRAGDAFDTHLAQWDPVLADLERLSPEASRALGGYVPGATSSSAAPMATFAQPNEVGQLWRQILGQRSGDLRAASDLGAAIPGWEAGLGERVAAQQARLRPYLGEYGANSQASFGARDILGGEVAPPDVPGFLAENLARLPVDPRVLRDLAFRGQAGAAAETFGLELGNLNETGVFNIANPGEIADPEAAVRGLRGLLSPSSGIYADLHPSVVRQFLSNTGEVAPGVAGDLAAARAAQSQLLQHLYGADRAAVERQILARAAQPRTAAALENPITADHWYLPIATGIADPESYTFLPQYANAPGRTQRILDDLFVNPDSPATAQAIFRSRQAGGMVRDADAARPDVEGLLTEAARTLLPRGGARGPLPPPEEFLAWLREAHPDLPPAVLDRVLAEGFDSGGGAGQLLRALGGRQGLGGTYHYGFPPGG